MSAIGQSPPPVDQYRRMTETKKDPQPKQPNKPESANGKPAAPQKPAMGRGNPQHPAGLSRKDLGNNNGQYDRSPTEGQYDRPPTEGQYGRPPTEGQYDRPPTEGEYNRPPTEGQYRRPANEGQYQPRPVKPGEEVLTEPVKPIPLDLEGYDENQKLLPVIGLIQAFNQRDVPLINQDIEAGVQVPRSAVPDVQQPQGPPPKVERYEYAGGTALLVGVKDPEAVKAQLDRFGDVILAPLEAKEKPAHMTQEEFERAQKTAQSIKQAGELGIPTVIYGEGTGEWSIWAHTRKDELNGRINEEYEAALEDWAKGREQALKDGLSEEEHDNLYPKPEPPMPITIDRIATYNRDVVEMGEKDFLDPEPTDGGEDPDAPNNPPAYNMEGIYTLGHEMLHAVDDIDRYINKEEPPQSEEEAERGIQVEEEATVDRMDSIRSFHGKENRTYYYPAIANVPDRQQEVEEHIARSEQGIPQRQQLIEEEKAAESAMA